MVKKSDFSTEYTRFSQQIENGPFVTRFGASNILRVGVRVVINSTVQNISNKIRGLDPFKKLVFLKFPYRSVKFRPPLN